MQTEKNSRNAPIVPRLRMLTPLSLLIRFLAMSAMGVLVLAAPAFVARWLNALCIAALLLNGLPAIAVSVLQRGRAHPHSLLGGLASVGAALLIAVFPQLLRKGVTLTVGVWSILICVVQLGYVVQLKLLHERGRLKFLLMAAISLMAGVVMLSSLGSGIALQWLAGLYLLIYALWQLFDMVGVLINRNVESSRLLSRLRLRLPVLLTAMLPSILLRRLSAEYAALSEDIVTQKPAPSDKWDDTLEVLFHLGYNVAFGFGHVDISLRGRTYSYGCYDEDSNRLCGLLSDGVFLVCDTQAYIPYCQQTEGKLLIGFTLGVSGDVAQRMEKAMLARLTDECEPWTPDGRPEYAFGAQFYKVRAGGFRLYNALRTNCAAMAEIIASNTGLNLLPTNGFVTPGAYFSYLESELRDPESNVLKQTIYAHR